MNKSQTMNLQKVTLFLAVLNSMFNYQNTLSKSLTNYVDW